MASRSPSLPVDISGQKYGVARTQVGGFVDEQLNDWIVMNDTPGSVNALMVGNAVTGGTVTLSVGGASPDTTANMSVAQLSTGTLALGTTQGRTIINGATVSIPGSLSVVNLTASGWINTVGLTNTTATITTGTITNLTVTNATASGWINTVGLTATTETVTTSTITNLAVSSSEIITASGATAFVVGPSGNTNPTFVVAPGAAAVNGLSVSGSASNSGVNVQVISAGPNEQVTISGKGTGNVRFGTNGATGNIGSILFQDTTLSGLTNNINVPSIPSGFKNIRAIFSGFVQANATQATVVVRLNADAGSNYDSQQLSVSGTCVTGAQSLGSATAAFVVAPALSVTRTSIGCTGQMVIPNYSGTTFEKSFQCGGGYVDSTAGQAVSAQYTNSWRNTAAVSGISVLVTSANFSTNSRLVVYLEN